MRDDDPGGPHDRSDDGASAGLRIAVLTWRLRLGSASVAAVFLSAGESAGLTFAAALVLAALVLAAGSFMARLEVRVHALRTRRR